jgi:hypothetical protein
MRPGSLCLMLLLAGCAGPGTAAGIAVGANVLALTTIHRTVPDAVISLLSGKDCSMVRLDENKSYCRAPHPIPPPPPYCTRTLGDVTCWRDPQDLPDHAPQVAEGAQTLSSAQLANRDRRWP